MDISYLTDEQVIKRYQTKSKPGEIILIKGKSIINCISIDFMLGWISATAFIGLCLLVFK